MTKFHTSIWCKCVWQAKKLGAHGGSRPWVKQHSGYKEGQLDREAGS